MRAFSALLLQILFGPWFFLYGIVSALHEDHRQLEFVGALFLCAVLLATFWTIVRYRKAYFMPSATVRALIAAFGFGLAGGFLNLLAIVANGLIMPMDRVPEYVNLFWITDAIQTGDAPLLRFIFQSHSAHVSVGDILLAAGFLLLWWTLLLSSGYAAVRRLLDFFVPRRARRFFK